MYKRQLVRSVSGRRIRPISASSAIRWVSGSLVRSVCGRRIRPISASSAIRWVSGSLVRSVSGRRIRTVSGCPISGVSWILMWIRSASSGVLIASYVDVLIVAAVMDTPASMRTLT